MLADAAVLIASNVSTRGEKLATTPPYSPDRAKSWPPAKRILRTASTDRHVQGGLALPVPASARRRLLLARACKVFRHLSAVRNLPWENLHATRNAHDPSTAGPNETRLRRHRSRRRILVQWLPAH